MRRPWNPTFFGLSVACLAGVFLTSMVVGWLRHRSYLKHRDSGFVPSTQDIVLKGLFVMGALELASLVFLVLAIVLRP